MTPEHLQNLQNALEKYPHRHEEIMLRWAAAAKLSELVIELGGRLGLFQEFQPKNSKEVEK